MSAPKFAVERHEDAHRRAMYWIKRESGEVVCITHHPDLARVIESHADLRALAEAVAEHYHATSSPLGKMARAALAKARREG